MIASLSKSMRSQQIGDFLRAIKDNERRIEKIKEREENRGGFWRSDIDDMKKEIITFCLAGIRGGEKIGTIHGSPEFTIELSQEDIDYFVRKLNPEYRKILEAKMRSDIIWHKRLIREHEEELKKITSENNSDDEA
jgi:hypothetical protein